MKYKFYMFNSRYNHYELKHTALGWIEAEKLFKLYSWSTTPWRVEVE